MIKHQKFYSENKKEKVSGGKKMNLFSGLNDKQENLPHKEKVNLLLVDDEPKNLTVLEEVLSPLDENLLKAGSGKEALRLVLSEKLALILLDIKMPVMDGFEVASMIRQNKKTSRIPIIFITGYDKSDLQMFKGYEVGAVDYLFRPINPKILEYKARIFVDLYRKTLELKRQKERIFEEQKKSHEQDLEIQELKDLLHRQKALTGWDNGAVTAKLSGVGPMRTRAKGVFLQLSKSYQSLLEDYLEALGFNQEPPRSRISEVAERLGYYGAGPRDVIDLHLSAVEEKSKQETAKRAMYLTTEGRLLAIEVMGYLVDYYRGGRETSGEGNS